MWLQVTLLFATLHIVLATSSCVATEVGEAAQAAAKAALMKAGLVDRGSHWELADDALLKRRLAQLERKRLEILAARRTLQGLMQENQVRWNQIGPRVGRLEQQLKSLPTDNKERRKIERQLATLRKTAVAPQKLGSVPQVRAIVKQLLVWELETLVKSQWSRATLTHLRETYPQLYGDRQIVQHLATVRGMMSSAEVFRKADEVLSACDEQVLAARTSMYEQGQQWRMGLILEERTPVTVSWIPKGEHLLLTPSVAATACVEDDASRKPLRLQVAPRRVVQVRPVLIRKLRIGSQLVEGVEAWVMPSEAEDLGTMLGEYAITVWRIHPEPALLQAIIRKNRP